LPLDDILEMFFKIEIIFSDDGRSSIGTSVIQRLRAEFGSIDRDGIMSMALPRICALELMHTSWIEEVDGDMRSQSRVKVSP